MADESITISNSRNSLKSSAVEASGSRRRQYAVALGKERKESLLRAKRLCRVRPGFSYDDGTAELEEEDMEMEEAQEEVEKFNIQLRSAIDELKSSVSLQEKCMVQKKVGALRKLRRLMTRSAFRPVETVVNSEVVPALVQCLSFGSPCEQLLEAAWCFTNIAAGSSNETRAILPALPLLIAHLGEQSSSAVAEQCAWALGNVASEGEDLRNILLTQGALLPLARMLLPNKGSVVRTAAWALSNLLKGPDPRAAIDLLKVEGIIDALHWHLKKDDVELATEVAWVIAYLTALSNSACSVLMNSNFLPTIIHRLVTSDSKELLIPVLRSLGNIISTDSLLFASTNHPQELTGSVIEALIKCLKREPPAMQKEAAWALSNIAAGHVDNKRAIFNGEAFPVLVSLFATAPFDTRKEVAYVLGNLCVETEEGRAKPSIVAECVKGIARSGCIVGFVNLAKSVDAEGAMIGLQFLELVLRGMPNNEGARIVEEAGGIEALERYQFHDNEELRNFANALIDKYFGVDFV